MSMTTRNLWPEDIAVSEDVPPVSILKEQGALLRGRTNELVEGQVRGTPSDYGRKYRYAFELVAPALDGYRYELFSITHGAEAYPLEIDWDSPDSHNLLAVAGEDGIQNEEGFLKALEIIFSSEKTRKVIASLNAQSRAMTEENP